MKEEIVFKCQFCGHRYQVVCMPNPRNEDKVVFATFKDRRHFDTFTWAEFEGAIGSIMIEHPEFDEHKFAKMWS